MKRSLFFLMAALKAKGPAGLLLTITGFIMVFTIVTAAPGTARATAFDLGLDSGDSLKIMGSTLTGSLSINGNGLGSGDVLTFNAPLSAPTTTGSGPTTTTVYNMSGTFTLLNDPKGTLTGTFTSAKLSASDTTIMVGLDLSQLITTNAYYNGSISKNSGLNTLFGLSGSNTTFTGGTVTFTQTYLPGLMLSANGSLTSGTAPASVPIPGALLLFGPGLAGLAFIRRRVGK